MNVYMDDMRNGNFTDDWGIVNWHNWVIVRSIDNVKSLLNSGLVEDMSLDHDMGRGDEHDGTTLCNWMEENNIWPVGNITVHSANPVGAERMRIIIKKHENQKDQNNGND